MEKIGDIIRNNNFPVRECKKYSFGYRKTCKNLFIEAFSEVDKTVDKFEWIPEYDQIIEWMTDTKGKGLALFGSIERGKTVINSFIWPVLFQKHFRKTLHPRSATEWTRENVEKWAFIIDDIGTEFIVNNFGSKTDMVEYAINNAEYYTKLLFLTGNLTEKELIERYGLRTYDRIKRLCKIVIFSGKSLRS